MSRRGSAPARRRPDGPGAPALSGPAFSGLFDPIAFAFSGGGSRAAGFHLGVLAYLDRVGLVDRVRVIASASGGSFAATTYAMARARGASFGEYYTDITTRLRTARIVEWCFDELSGGRPRNRSGRRSLLTALAEVYDRHFFEGFRFGDLLAGEARSPLREVVFSATDFRTGLGWRFRLHGDSGNATTPIPFSLLQHARLADVMAASSCMPGGLEPVFFPHDFVWEGEAAERACDTIVRTIARQGVDTIHLMDGGIYDNQAVESTLLAAEVLSPREERPARLGASVIRDIESFADRFDTWFRLTVHEDVPDPPELFILSDTPLDTLPVYRRGFEEGPTGKLLQGLKPVGAGGITLAGVARLWWALVVICLLTGAGLALQLVDRLRTAGTLAQDADDLLATLAGLTLAGGVLAVLWWLRAHLRDVLASLDHLMHTEGTRAALGERHPRAWPRLKRLTLREAASLIGLRLTSLTSLTGDIFSIRTRIMSYAMLYSLPGWRDRTLPNEAYVVAHNPAGSLAKPSERMREVAHRAAHLPTAFWYEQHEDLDLLVANGQMCICRNLIEHLRRRRRHDPAWADRWSAEIAALKGRLWEDWERLQADPLALVPGRTG
jgi:predicted acylesterase/phospholipase RssA